MSEFYILLGLAIILSFIPIINVPFKTIETFAHEMSHGLMAILTFGRMHRIHIQSDGSGYCTTSGGFRPFILIAGYTGASTVGVMIYYIATILKTQQAENILYGTVVFIIFSTIMWARDFRTIFSFILIGFVFYFPLKHELYEVTSIYLKFIGMYVALSALRAPLNLIDGRNVGDGAELFKYTLLPEGFWIVGWVFYGLYCVYNIYLIAELGKAWTTYLI